jgi:hypothetical protein
VTEDTDPYRLIAYFADREVPFTGGSLRTSISAPPEADLVCRVSDLLANAVDYLFPVSVQSAAGEVAFEGAVVDATPTGDEVTVECRGARELVETLAFQGDVQHVEHIEVVYAMARAAGFAEENIVITGLDALQHEPIEVVVPLRGIEVAQPLDVGNVELLPATAGAEVVQRFNPAPRFAGEFSDSSAYVRAICAANRLFDAEQEGIQLIDRAISWLTVRANFGYAVLPDGIAQRFRRVNALARPRRLPVVAVRGMETGRRWMGRRLGEPVDTQMGFGSDSHLESPPLPVQIADADANALDAARRALIPGDTALRIHALWEAFEFYVARRSSPDLFTKADRETIVEAARPSLTEPQVSRLREVVSGPLNDLPLMRKLLDTFTAEGISLRQADKDVLSRLRKARNRTMHGDASEAEREEDLQHGCAILTRALVVRIASSSA